MGMSYSVVGIRDSDDEKFKKYIAIVNSLEAAGMSWEDAPDEVLEFFDHSEPDDSGIIVELGSEYGALHDSVSRTNKHAHNGFEIDLSKLPKNITKVRFVMSY